MCEFNVTMTDSLVYSHLTVPTKRIVYGGVVAVSLKKKKKNYYYNY